MARLAAWLHCCAFALAGTPCGASRPLPVDAEEEFSLLQVQSNTQVRAPKDTASEYFWYSRGRDAATNSYADYAAPTDFSMDPAWVWQNDDKEMVKHSPMIDADKNIYVTTTRYIRKFDSDGNLLWKYDAGKVNAIITAPAMYNGSIYILPINRIQHADESHDIAIVTLDMNSGIVNWQRTLTGINHFGDAQGLLVTEGMIFFGATNSGEGTDTVVAASASDGSVLWQFPTNETMWNFKPSTPGDRSLLFSSMCGVVYRISFEGSLMWKAGGSYPDQMCVTAGGALGPNGIFYAEYNHRVNQNITGTDTLSAYNVTDGSLVWERDLPYRAAQYPAVGKLGSDGPLAVVAALGDNPMVPRTDSDTEPYQAYLSSLGGALKNMVIAFDAGTGATLWESEEDPYPHAVAAGELDEHNYYAGTQCNPDAQGIPLISGDGTVYTSSGHHGDLRAIRDSNNDGVISPSEVSTFKTGKCFKNSPSIAPGLLVAAPCWGPMYVFKS